MELILWGLKFELRFLQIGDVDVAVEAEEVDQISARVVSVEATAIEAVIVADEAHTAIGIVMEGTEDDHPEAVHLVDTVEEATVIAATDPAHATTIMAVMVRPLVATTDRETETAAAAEEEVTSHAILDHTAEVEVEAYPVALTVDRHHPARTATFKTTIHSYDSLQFLCVCVLCFYL